MKRTILVIILGSTTFLLTGCHHFHPVQKVHKKKVVVSKKPSVDKKIIILR